MYSNSLDRTLFYSNMTVSLCIRQESKRNEDSVSVEELDWSKQLNTSGVTLNETKTHHQTPMTCTFIIWTKVLTPPSLEEKKALPNCGNKDGNIINLFKNYISTSVATVFKCMT